MVLCLNQGRGEVPDKQIVAFQHDQAKLTSTQAGHRWSALALRPTMKGNRYDERLPVLPGPESWPTIARELETKGDLRLKLFASCLTGDKKKQRALIVSLVGERLDDYRLNEQFLKTAISWKDEPLLRMAIAPLIRPKKGSNHDSITLPNLAGHLGVDRAKPIIRDILLKFQGIVYLKSELDTQVAIQICRTEIKNLPYPHYEFTQSLGTVDLFLEFRKRFSKVNPSAFYTDYYRKKADLYYALTQIAEGKGDKFLDRATEFSEAFGNMRSFDSSLDKALDSYCYSPKTALSMWKYFSAVLIKNPNLHLWVYLNSSAETANKLKETIPLFVSESRSSHEKNDFNVSYLADAIGKTGSVDDQIKLFTNEVNAPKGSNWFLIDFGNRLNRLDLIEMGLARNAKAGVDNFSSLMELGRYEAAEKLLRARQKKEKLEFRDLCSLVHVLSLLGHDKEILALLDTEPNWGFRDLWGFANLGRDYDSDDSRLALHDIGKAFIKSGKKNLGHKCLLLCLEADPSNDDYYPALIESVDSATALSHLDHLFKSNPFESRPLIWMAKVLLGKGSIDEAERTIRLAISHQPYGRDYFQKNRMLAYKVLSAILAKQGHQKESAAASTIFESAELGAKAGEVARFNLSSQEKRMFEEAIKLNPNDPMLHFKLAETLERERDTNGASKQFERTFELLVTKQGRVGPGQFGPDNIFWVMTAKDVGERVLPDLIAKNPNRPYGHYLLGLIRKNQGRLTEASGLFRRAVQLDPDFLDAWKQLIESACTSKDAEDAIVNIVRLDPAEKTGRYFGWKDAPVKDLPRIYLAMAKRPLPLRLTGSFYRLKLVEKDTAAYQEYFPPPLQTADLPDLTPGGVIGAMAPCHSILPMTMIIFD